MMYQANGSTYADVKLYHIKRLTEAGNLSHEGGIVLRAGMQQDISVDGANLVSCLVNRLVLDEDGVKLK